MKKKVFVLVIIGLLSFSSNVFALEHTSNYILNAFYESDNDRVLVLFDGSARDLTADFYLLNSKGETIQTGFDEDVSLDWYFDCNGTFTFKYSDGTEDTLTISEITSEATQCYNGDDGSDGGSNQDILDRLDTLNNTNNQIKDVLNNHSNALDSIDNSLKGIKNELTTDQPPASFPSLEKINLDDHKPDQPQSSFTDNNDYFSDNGHETISETIPQAPDIDNWQFEGEDLLPEDELTSDSQLDESPEMTPDQELLPDEELLPDQEPTADEEPTRDSQLDESPELSKDSELSTTPELSRDEFTQDEQMTQDQFTQDQEMSRDDFNQNHHYDKTNEYEQSYPYTKTPNDYGLRWEQVKGVKQ